MRANVGVLRDNIAIFLIFIACIIECIEVYSFFGRISIFFNVILVVSDERNIASNLFFYKCLFRRCKINVDFFLAGIKIADKIFYVGQNLFHQRA